MKKSALFRGFVFLLALLIALCSVQVLFGLGENSCYEHIRGFLREERNSLDAVYIGASDVHALWQPLFGWADYGIAVWNYSIDALPIKSIKYLCTEVQKTQSDPLFIISLSTFKKESLDSIVPVHRTTNYLPLSVNKLRLIDALTEDLDCTLSEKLELYFPIIRFHSRWNLQQPPLFTDSGTLYKASSEFPEFLYHVKDVHDSYETCDTFGAVPDTIHDVLSDLLDYCDKENLSVLFVKSPQAANYEQQEIMNSLEKIVIERGYPCFDVLEEIQSTNLDFRTDYYDRWHTNIHGSLKFSSYLGKYLVENYNFKDKRGQDGWKSWDDALARYSTFISPYVFPFELDHSHRFLSAIPKLYIPSVDSEGIAVNWESIDHVDGYFIYRKSNAVWSLLDTVDAETSAYVDRDIAPSTEYTYTVVPYSKNGGETLYGSFNVNGLSCQTGGE